METIRKKSFSSNNEQKKSHRGANTEEIFSKNLTQKLGKVMDMDRINEGQTTKPVNQR